jgi:hypothetical protein
VTARVALSTTDHGLNFPRATRMEGGSLWIDLEGTTIRLDGTNNELFRIVEVAANALGCTLSYVAGRPPVADHSKTGISSYYGQGSGTWSGD